MILSASGWVSLVCSGSCQPGGHVWWCTQSVHKSQITDDWNSTKTSHQTTKQHQTCSHSDWFASVLSLRLPDPINPELGSVKLHWNRLVLNSRNNETISAPSRLRARSFCPANGTEYRFYLNDDIQMFFKLYTLFPNTLLRFLFFFSHFLHPLAIM